MKWIADIKTAWRMLSVQMLAFAGVINLAWIEYAPQLSKLLTEKQMHEITLGVVIIGIVGRLIQQPKATPIASGKVDGGE